MGEALGGADFPLVKELIVLAAAEAADLLIQSSAGNDVGVNIGTCHKLDRYHRHSGAFIIYHGTAYLEESAASCTRHLNIE